jgi:hypothetical protein
MIFSKNRFPLLGIMLGGRGDRLAGQPRGTAGVVFLSRVPSGAKAN